LRRAGDWLVKEKEWGPAGISEQKSINVSLGRRISTMRAKQKEQKGERHDPRTV